MTTETNPNQNNFWEVLNKITNLLPIIGILSSIFGAIVTFVYLRYIKQDAIFPDILTSPSALLALIISFMFFYGLTSISFIMPYLILPYINIPLKHINIPLKQNKWKYKKFIFKLKSRGFYQLYIVANIFIYILFLILGFLNSYYLTLFFIIVFLLFAIIVAICSIKEGNCINNIENLIIILFFFLISFTTNFFFCYISLDITKNFENGWDLAVFLVLNIIWITAYALNGMYARDSYNKKQKFKLSNLIVPYIILLITLSCIFSLGGAKQLSGYILRLPHFIENPRDSTWYTIDTRFFAPNNLTVQEIQEHDKNLKEYLNIKGESQCSDLQSDPKKKNECETIENKFNNHKCIRGESQCSDLQSDPKKKNECETTENKSTNQKYNRFYGYIAWNLGDTKVFCPYGYEQTTSDKDESNDMRCLALKGEYIIPYY